MPAHSKWLDRSTRLLRLVSSICLPHSYGILETIVLTMDNVAMYGSVVPVAIFWPCARCPM